MKRKLVELLFAGACTFIAAGCSSSIAKQNVLSAINTGIGVTVAQNPQTQFYEGKIGYVRSQFYSVPTGKTVCEDHCSKAEKDPNHQCTPSNAADTAVELLSGIRVHSGIENLLLGVDVTESFAIGHAAVTSPVAAAMYVSQAKDPKRAQAAAEASSQYNAAAAQKVDAEDKMIDDIIKFAADPGDAAKLVPAKVDSLTAGTDLDQYKAAIATWTSDVFKRKLQRGWSSYIGALHNNIH